MPAPRWTARRLAGAASAALLLPALAACGDGGAGGDGGDTASKDPVTVAVTFKDGEVTPSGDRVDLAVGQELDLEVTADEPGEIHVHSDPEQELQYGQGTKTFTLDFDRPGQIEVESHTLDVVILQLEVR